MDNEAAGNGAQGPDRPESDPEKTGDVDMNKIPEVNVSHATVLL